MDKISIVVDIDGTIAENKTGDLTYATVKPFPGAVEALQHWHDEGHRIILYTGRGHRTYRGNVGEVLANRGKELMDWLAFYKIPYDELHMSKPHGDIIIDDCVWRHTDWESSNAAIERRIEKGIRTPENP